MEKTFETELPTPSKQQFKCGDCVGVYVSVGCHKNVVVPGVIDRIHSDKSKALISFDKGDYKQLKKYPTCIKYFVKYEWVTIDRITDISDCCKQQINKG